VPNNDLADMSRLRHEPKSAVYVVKAENMMW
jgi:hypothetical protein